ncbi:MAG: hypothetical protein EOM59_19815 [Clostridia bacterium]|nr:hypothetical protein [Clostridia bacterium]
MSHTPELLHVIEQNERDKDARCVRLVDSNGVFALVIDEKYGERIAALWNMAERLGLATEEINTKESLFRAAADMLEALELVVGHKGFDIEYIHYRCRLAIKEARGEE